MYTSIVLVALAGSTLSAAVPESLVADVRALLARRGEALAYAAEIVAGASGAAGARIRHHGDFHLGQTLRTRNGDFVIVDFEGEPARPLAERRQRHSALRDVAGMLRSFDYARHTALNQTAQNAAATLERLAPVARQTERRIREAFLRTYRTTVVAGGLYADDDSFERGLTLLDLFELEKALYELRYEMDNRPDWVGVPLAGIAALAEIPGAV